MHSLTSRNQLNEWRHFQETVEEENLNDYYECLIECDINSQTSCKKICKELLM
jgi:hypothetical protein